MDGPSHYGAAEQYLDNAFDANSDGDFVSADHYREMAQTHAVLALAAAQALGTSGPLGDRWHDAMRGKRAGL